MSVESWQHEWQGHVVAEVRWSAVPDVAFKLELGPGGRLVEFCARGANVSARGLRRAPIGEMQRVVRRQVAEDVRLHEGDVPAMVIRTESGDRIAEPLAEPSEAEAWAWRQQRRAMRDVARDFLERPRPGAAGREDRHYADVARAYVDLLDAGSARPVAELAENLGVSTSTARNYLYAARERGLLTSVGRGRSGGELTEKAKEVLSDGTR